MTSTQRVRFYYDFISPYAYLGWVGLRQMATSSQQQLTIEPIPVLFAGLLNHWGQKGPAEIPAKRVFTYQDAIRKGAKAGLSLQFPPAHPFNPLLPLRLMVALENAPQRDDAISRIYEACWQQAQDITQPDVLNKLLEDLGVDDPNQLLASTQQATIKDTLRQHTEDAIAAGVFGVPSFGIGETLLWGSDQLDFVTQCLQGQDPATTYGLERLAALQATATR